MKKLYSIVVAFAIMFCGFIFVGCGPKVYELDQVMELETTYNINDQFAIVGKTLKLKEKGTENFIEVTITADMVKQLPDMSTAGEKTVTLTYKNVEYSVGISVVDPQQQYLEKLQSYLQNYQNGSVDEVDFAVSANFGIQFFNGQVHIDALDKNWSLDKQSADLSKSAVEQATGIEDIDAILTKVYETITDALIKSGLNIQATNIVDLAKNESALALDQILGAIITEVGNSGLLDLLESTISKYLAQGCDIVSNALGDIIKLNETGVQALSSALQGFVKNIVSGEIKAQPILAVLMNEVNYSDNFVCECINNVFKFITQPDQEFTLFEDIKTKIFAVYEEIFVTALTEKLQDEGEAASVYGAYKDAWTTFARAVDNAIKIEKYENIYSAITTLHTTLTADKTGGFELMTSPILASILEVLNTHITRILDSGDNVSVLGILTSITLSDVTSIVSTISPGAGLIVALVGNLLLPAELVQVEEVEPGQGVEPVEPIEPVEPSIFDIVMAIMQDPLAYVNILVNEFGEMFELPETVLGFWNEVLFPNLHAEKFSGEQFVDAVKEFATKYELTAKQNKTLCIAVAVGSLIIFDEEKLEDIDFNDLFAGVNIFPQGVTVNYNDLVDKILNGETWENCITHTPIKNIIIENQDGFVGESFEITLNLEVDLTVIKLIGDLTLTITLENA